MLVRERQITYDITYMWNLKYDTNELIYRTETDSQADSYGYQRGGGINLGVWDYQLQTTIYKIDKQQGPSV